MADSSSMAAKIALKVDGRGDLFSTAHQVIFGTDAADTLTGKDQRDHLYGGDGDDSLIGGDGADYLEGGNGVDIYQAADGDILFDADSQGVVILAGKRLGGATQRLARDGLRMRLQLTPNRKRQTTVGMTISKRRITTPAAVWRGTAS